MKISRYKILLALFDYLLLNFSFSLALRLRFMPSIDIIDIKTGYIIEEVLVFSVISIFALLIFESSQLYKYNIITTGIKQFFRLLKVLVIIVLFLVCCTFVFHLGSKYESRLFNILFFAVSVFLFTIYRIFLFRPLFKWMHKKGYYKRNVVIYGAGKRGDKVLEKIKSVNRWNFLGFIDDEKRKDRKHHILGNFRVLRNLRHDSKVDTVIIAIDKIDHKRLQELIDSLKLLGVRIFVESENYDVLYKTQKLEMIGELEIIELNYNSKNLYLNITKRLTDIVLTITGLIILLPFFLVIALVIIITSKGPVIFKQTRIGKYGRPFDFYKFRSMYTNNKPVDHQKFAKSFINGKVNGTQKMKNDPRVTPIGRFLRKTSIDELPQLFNVIKGDMSLVGPRPCLPYEYEEYKDWHKSRFMVRPGCTGVWQVSGRSNVTFEEMVVMDYYYIHNMSPWLDIKLMMQTIPVMVLSRGGY